MVNSFSVCFCSTLSSKNSSLPQFSDHNSNGVAPRPYSNWSLMEPSTGAYPKRLFLRLL